MYQTGTVYLVYRNQNQFLTISQPASEYYDPILTDSSKYIFTIIEGVDCNIKCNYRHTFVTIQISHDAKLTPISYAAKNSSIARNRLFKTAFLKPLTCEVCMIILYTLCLPE